MYLIFHNYITISYFLFLPNLIVVLAFSPKKQVYRFMISNYIPHEIDLGIVKN